VTRVGGWWQTITTWGSTAAERRDRFACDDLLPDASGAYWRAVDVDAPAALVYRWLCQLRAAPYSYDLLDNLGRRSPQRLTLGLGSVTAGDRIMTIFRAARVVPGQEFTAVWRTPVPIAVTYRVTPRPGRTHASRLIAKLVVRYPAGPAGGLLRLLLPAGDAFMMRGQLLNLKRLAERDARRRGAGAG
jgi:hypothetical protein